MKRDASDLKVAVEGQGPTVLLVHGTAADLNAWSIQRAGLRSKLRLITYDRRGMGGSPMPAGADVVEIPEHAEDAAALLATYAPAEQVVACGSSCGAVVLLELLRRHPERVRRAILIEPPIPPSDEGAEEYARLVPELEEVAAREGPGKAAERFLRTVLGDAGFERIPRVFHERMPGMWPGIRSDCIALVRYRVGYATLKQVRTPVLLLGGERSVPRYRETLHALEKSLADARTEILGGAGHMVQADAFRRFNALLLEAAAG